jgi:chromosome segregation ATPase
MRNAPNPLLFPHASVTRRNFPQTPSTDSETLQVLLGEVRQLRQELKTTTAAVERAQILIYRLQFQEAVVARDVQRLDDARAKLTQSQTAYKELERDIKRIEDRRANSNTIPEQKQNDEQLARTKTYMETVLLPQEQQNQARVTDCEQQLRLEQEKLTEFQDQLDQLDAVLKKSAAQ